MRAKLDMTRGIRKKEVLLITAIVALVAAGGVLTTIALAARGGPAAIPNSVPRSTSADAASGTTSNLPMAPDFALKDLNGKEVKLSDFRGKIVIVNFWATWCGPCRAEIPSFVRIRDEYSDKGLEIIGVSLDEGSPEAVRQFVREMKMNYPVVLGDEKTADKYGPIDAVPTTFFVGRSGGIIGHYEGMMTELDLKEEIAKALKSRV